MTNCSVPRLKGRGNAQERFFWKPWLACRPPAPLQAVDHPRGRNNSSVVKMDVFYSMWGAQTVPCPWGSGKPACKTVLLHHEQVRVQEHAGPGRERRA